MYVNDIPIALLLATSPVECSHSSLEHLRYHNKNAISGNSYCNTSNLKQFPEIQLIF